MYTDEVCSTDIIINEDVEHVNIHKEKKREIAKIANDLVKNYFLLKELNLLTLIKEEKQKEKKKQNEKKEQKEQNDDNINNDKISRGSAQRSYGKDIIYANKYMLDVLVLREKEREREKKRKKEKREMEKGKEKEIEKEIKKELIKGDTVFTDEDINVILNNLKRNEFQLSTYKNNIISCGKLSNFRKWNKTVKTTFLNSFEKKNLNNFDYEYDSYTKKVHDLLDQLITNYNSTLEVIKIQQNVMNNFFFYLENLLLNNKKLMKQNKKLITDNFKNTFKDKDLFFLIANKNKLLKKEEKERKSIMEIFSSFETANRNYNDNNENNNNNNHHNNNNNNKPNDKDHIKKTNRISDSFKSQIDLYREHINYLYTQNDDLKNMLNLLNEEENVFTDM